MKVSEYIDRLASRGRHHFTEEEALKATGLSRVAFRSAVRRLKKKNRIAVPLRGFYSIIPLENRSLGSLPPEEFIPYLMEYLGQSYYVSLLSAAQFYGATHQQPQIFHVIVAEARRDLTVGLVRVSFVKKREMKKSSTRQFNTPRGYVSVATPEVLVLDLLTYPQKSGGMYLIFDVLNELKEQLDLKVFKSEIKKEKNIPIIQRLGYLFEKLGFSSFADACEARLKKENYVRKVVLDIREKKKEGPLDMRWNLIINQELESDFDT